MAVIDLATTDDGQLVGASTLQEGEDPFEQLYRLYAADLRRFCHRRLGSAAEADDACHEAMIRALRALPAFRTGARVWPWLATIAANVCTDMLRTRRFRALDDRDGDDDAPDVHDEVMTRLRQELVGDALDGLPDRYRRTIYLCDLEGWSYEEIAEADGTTVAAVRGTLHRGRRALRERVQQVARQKGIWPLPAAVPLRWRDRVASLRAWASGSDATALFGTSGVAAANAIGAAIAMAGLALPMLVDVAAADTQGRPVTLTTTHVDGTSSPQPPGAGRGDESTRSAPPAAPDGAVAVPETTLPVEPETGVDRQDGVVTVTAGARVEPDDGDGHEAEAPVWANLGCQRSELVERTCSDLDGLDGLDAPTPQVG